MGWYKALLGVGFVLAGLTLGFFLVAKHGYIVGQVVIVAVCLSGGYFLLVDGLTTRD